MGSTACCNSISLPVSSHVPTGNDGKPVPLRGTIGYSLFGVNIYGAMENGFALGFACSNGKGSCPAGLDVDTCYYKLVKECGFANVKRTLLPDVCGGHVSFLKNRFLSFVSNLRLLRMKGKSIPCEFFSCLSII